MSESDDIPIAAPIRGGKLTLDSEEQDRKEAEERQIQQEIRLRKQQKRKRRQQSQRLALQKAKNQEEKQKKYFDPQLMFQEDSNSHTSYGRVQKKIKKQFPQFRKRDQRKNQFIDDSQDQDESQGQESGSSSQSKKKNLEKKKRIQKPVQKKVQKKRPKYQPQQVEQKRVKKQRVKIEPKNDRKENLVRQLSVRWWYALPQWPPKDYDYEGKLKKQGYRVLDPERFRLQDDIVGGLQKVIPVDGYLGVYKSKTKLIDIRPKQSAPTLNRFRSMSLQQLTGLVKKALKQQIQQLKNVKYVQQGEEELIKQLEKQLIKMK